MSWRRGIWSGLLAGLIFLHYGQLLDGLAANREWFAGLPLLGAVWLYLASVGREGRR